MPRKRNSENIGLPKRWRHYHGAYFYAVPKGLEHLWDGKRQFRLGDNLTEAYRVWASRLELHSDARTIGELLERYTIEILPTKAAKTQATYLPSIKSLTAVFGKMPISALEPMDVYKYRDKRGKTSRVQANHDIGVLSTVYTTAVEWGLCRHNPIIGNVKKLPVKPRDRYVEDWEVEEALTVASPFIRRYVRIKILTGLRKTDLLSVKFEHLEADGIHVVPAKTKNTSRKHLIIEWTEELRNAVDDARKASKSSIWLFSTREGKSYVNEAGTPSGFNSVWQRFMAKVLAKTKVKIRFTEHDLRAKTGSDVDDIGKAQSLLAHADPATTRRIYRRKAERVKPLR